MSHELRIEAGKELAEIERRDGKLLRRKIVEKAKDPKTALHQYFIWDEGEAAQRYWLETAGALIRAYKVWVTVSGSETPTKVRAYVSLSSDRAQGGGYRSLVSVIDDEGMRATMLADAIRDLKVFQRKYEMLAELESIFAEIEKVVRMPRAAKPQEMRASA